MLKSAQKPASKRQVSKYAHARSWCSQPSLDFTGKDCNVFFKYQFLLAPNGMFLPMISFIRFIN
jgi:hypothetical protein